MGGFNEWVKLQVVAHRKWRLGRNGGHRADFSHQDLSDWHLVGIDLGGAELVCTAFSGANMREANLQGANLFMADLEGADLTGADLRGADLRGARLKGCKLSDARLDGANLGKGSIASPVEHGPERTHRDSGAYACDMTETRLQRAILINANLADCDLTGADLTAADLSGADLTDSILVNARLTDLRCDRTVFKGAVMFGAELDPALRKQFAAAGASFSFGKAALSVMSVVNDHQSWVHSGGSAGSACDLDMVDLTDAVLARADLSGARLRRSNLRGADLSGAQLGMADLSYSDLSGANLTGADLSGTNMRGCNLQGAVLRGARLVPMAVMDESGKPWPTNLERCRLRGADFGEARIDRPMLRGAELDPLVRQALSGAGVDTKDLDNTVIAA